MDEPVEGRFVELVVASFHDDDLPSEHLRRRKYIASLNLADDGFKETKNHRGGNRVTQKREPLAPEQGAEMSHSGNIASRPIQAGNKAFFRIGRIKEDDRYGRGGRLRRMCRLV